MFLPEHLRLIVGDKESYGEEHVMVPLVEFLARKILNDESDFAGTAELLQAAHEV